MRDDASIIQLSGDPDERLMRRVGSVIDEIERMKEERDDDPTRAAIIHLQAVHAAKRLRKLIGTR